MPNLPSVTLYIRRNRARKQYEKVSLTARTFAPLFPGDHYCLHVWQDGKRKWIRLETRDGMEAVRARISKEEELLSRSAKPDITPTAAKSLEELRNAFLAMKRKERKRDRTPLDEDTIRAYERLVQDFIYISKCQYPGDVTGDRVNEWMLVLEDGYVGADGKEHKPAAPRTVYNLFTNLGCFLRYCGIEPNPGAHNYGLRKLQGVNVPGKNETDPEAFTAEEMEKFFFVITEERDALAFEVFLKSGPREQELANLEWTDLNLGATPWVAYQCKLGFRTKTGKSRRVPLERRLADKLVAWHKKNPGTRYVFPTQSGGVEGHFLRIMHQYVEASGQTGVPPRLLAR